MQRKSTVRRSKKDLSSSLLLADPRTAGKSLFLVLVSHLSNGLLWHGKSLSSEVCIHDCRTQHKGTSKVDLDPPLTSSPPVSLTL